MKANHEYDMTRHEGVLEHATLYLCRQGHTWVVVMESTRTSRALRLRPAGADSFDARFVLLSAARRACPDASIVTTDGALEAADCEWRLDVRSVVAGIGDLGAALHRELSDHGRRGHERRPGERRATHRCLQGRCRETSGRPRSF
jgi:hypothetical protein